MKSKVTHDEATGRFEIQTEGNIAYLTYVISGKILDIIHTFVPKELRGRGIASSLVEAAYRFSLEEGYSCQASCPYARIWLNENR